MQAFPQDISKLLTFSVFSVVFEVKLCFIYKISQNYTDLRYLLDIKVLTQQAKGGRTLVAYCCGKDLECVDIG